ncbi:hypothetical protein WA158_005547 [Blastocystis sp. Blastoise]
MHFGKIIQRAMSTAPKEWEPYWMNYKQFKEILVDVVEEIDRKEGEGDEDINITDIDNDKHFFSELAKSLDKVDLFFNKTQSELYNSVRDLAEKAEKLNTIPEEERDRQLDILIGECIRINGQLVLLEVFAHVNYCGFSKITKKHDKLTKFTTQLKFMKNKVNNKRFSDLVILTQLIKTVAEIYKSLSIMKKNSQVEPLNKYEHETQQIESSLKETDSLTE